MTRQLSGTQSNAFLMTKATTIVISFFRKAFSISLVTVADLFTDKRKQIALKCKKLNSLYLMTVNAKRLTSILSNISSEKASSIIS